MGSVREANNLANDLAKGFFSGGRMSPFSLLTPLFSFHAFFYRMADNALL